MVRFALPKNSKSVVLGLASLLFLSTQGHAADAVQNCWKQNKSHVGAVACEAAEAKKIEALLEAQMVKQLKEAKETEKIAKDAGSVQYEGLSKQLVDSQKAFDIYKKLQCEYEVATYGAGTFGADAAYACEIALMNERLARLKKF